MYSLAQTTQNKDLLEITPLVSVSFHMHWRQQKNQSSSAADSGFILEANDVPGKRDDVAESVIVTVASISALFRFPLAEEKFMLRTSEYSIFLWNVGIVHWHAWLVQDVRSSSRWTAFK